VVLRESGLRCVQRRPVRPITALEALDACEEALEVYAARVYVAEDEGGYIWLNLAMLSQDKATRVVRVPVGLLVDADGQQNGDRRTDLANHGVLVPALASTGEPHCAVVVGVPAEAGEASEDRGHS